LDSFRIEIPSWAFANTGTRFGKYLQPAAATCLEEKFADAAQVNFLTGVTPQLALHVLWDLAGGLADVGEVKQLSARYGIRAGAINPNLFQNQEYKLGSICNPDAGVRIVWLEAALCATHGQLSEGQRLLIEYKPFEPAFYHTDVADWGMAVHLSQAAGPQARVLVDTGHHYQSQNIEQIVAWLLHKKLLGGFHFNDRRYADDDLTIGSIDPYQVFRIFHEIFSEEDPAAVSGVAYMIDQSHNLKGKMEAMVQTVMMAQELFLKAALVDRPRLAELQSEGRILEAEECLRSAFWTDVRPFIKEWRLKRGLPPNPLEALYQSGYVERAARERGDRNMTLSTSYA